MDINKGTHRARWACPAGKEGYEKKLVNQYPSFKVPTGQDGLARWERRVMRKTRKPVTLLLKVPTGQDGLARWERRVMRKNLYNLYPAFKGTHRARWACPMGKEGYEKKLSLS